VDRPRVVDEGRDPRYEPMDAPEAPSFPVPEPFEDGDRGYKPIKPRSGLGDLLRKLAAPIVALGFLIVKFGGFILKFKVVTTGLSMLAGSTFAGDIISTTSIDRLNVAGTVFLADAGLSLSAGVGFNPQANQLFPLIINDLDDLVSGTFAGLPEGSTVVVSGFPFQLSYAANLDAGAVGNDVALTAIPEPGSAVLLLGGFGMLIGAQRMRRRGRA